MEQVHQTPESSGEKLRKQKEFFGTGATLDPAFRVRMLKKLYEALQHDYQGLTEALEADLGKCESEGYMCEVGLALAETGYQLRHLKKWAAPKRKATSMINSFGKSYTKAEPLGSVLIMAPWNYPVMLSLEPLAGALAAGNTAILKPSAYAPRTAHAIAELIGRIFPPEYVTVVEGGRKENSDLLDLPFDHIFFTGSAAVGKVVLERAARNLTPATLELGGKSPVVVERSCDIRLTARRIVFGKLLNCGQTCVAPDYVLVERAVHDALLAELKNQFTIQCPDPLGSGGYAHVVNEKHFRRLLGLMDAEKVVFGGEHDAAKLKIAPTILDGVGAEDAVMGEEIFGPILPLITVEDMEEAEAFIRAADTKPLALYVFTRDRAVADRFMHGLPFGGGCVNDTISQTLACNLPFGGVGASGMGKYHGEYSFRAFSHEKAVVKKFLFPELPMRYTPYKKLYEKIIRLVER